MRAHDCRGGMSHLDVGKLENEGHQAQASRPGPRKHSAPDYLAGPLMCQECRVKRCKRDTSHPVQRHERM